jgi:circadian clock protein KaiC
LTYGVGTERVSSGIPKLDEMLGAKGFYKGSSVLVSGTAGTGKTTIAAEFIRAACERGERALYLAFEESPDQIMRNMLSVGIDLRRHVKSGRLQFQAMRTTAIGLEQHLLAIQHKAEEFRPHVMIMDPLSNLISVGTTLDVKMVLSRIIDHFKMKGITAVFTSLTSAGEAEEKTSVGVSSLMDTWLMLSDIKIGGERNRVISIIKSRGMSHSNQMREFKLAGQGVELSDVYVGPEGVLTGTARAAQEARERAEAVELAGEVKLKETELDRKREAFKAQVATLQADLKVREEEIAQEIRRLEERQNALTTDREEMASLRKGRFAEAKGSKAANPKKGSRK